MLVKLQAKIENDAGAEATRYKNNSYRYTTFKISYYIYTHTHTHPRLTALFRDYPGGPVPER